MQHQVSVRYSVGINKFRRKDQSECQPYHGGDSEGSGCGVCLGVNCSFELLRGVVTVGGLGMSGCLTAFAGDGGGDCRITGVFGEKGVAEGTVMLVLICGSGVWELMKNIIKSAMIGMMMRRTSTVAPSGVKRK